MTTVHDKLKTLESGAKHFAKYLSKPYSSIAGNDFEISDAGNYYAPMIRNLMGIAVIGTAYCMMAGKLPEIQPQYLAALGLDTLLEGQVVTALASAIKKIKK
jgi:hypothetical protein